MDAENRHRCLPTAIARLTREDNARTKAGPLFAMEILAVRSRDWECSPQVRTPNGAESHNDASDAVRRKPEGVVRGAASPTLETTASEAAAAGQRDACAAVVYVRRCRNRREQFVSAARRDGRQRCHADPEQKELE